MHKRLERERERTDQRSLFVHAPLAELGLSLCSLAALAALRLQLLSRLESSIAACCRVHSNFRDPHIR